MTRVTMHFRVFIFMAGAVFFHYQVLAGNIYIAELMVETNTTVEAETILSILSSTSDLQVNDADGAPHTVTLTSTELVAECLIIGIFSECNCSTGYIWNNPTCENYNCCRDTPCKANVSHLTPLCIAKVTVLINGSVELQTTWDAASTDKLVQAFEPLNGLEYVNLTGYRSTTTAEFEVAVSAKFPTTKLQKIVDGLKESLQAAIKVDTVGMVTMEAPNSTVCYLSEPELTCTFDEDVMSRGWSFKKPNEFFQLKDGSVVQLIPNCDTLDHKSCTAVKLRSVTSSWAGLYQCEFYSGSIVHMAKYELKVAQLPDVIILKSDPLTVQCKDTSKMDAKIIATIPKTTQHYEVWWSLNGDGVFPLQNETDDELLVYTFTAPVSCVKVPDAQYVNITFENMKGQTKTAKLDIPVIYAGKGFCDQEVLNGDVWPVTPAGQTLINRTCPEGRTGYRSRTCDMNRVWQEVFPSCVSEELVKVVTAADNFLKGMGATSEVAQSIFEGLKNSSTIDPDSSDSTADIAASINVLDTMSKASKNNALQEDIFPTFVEAASNLLNDSWSRVNDSIRHNMSSNYLLAVEDLVKNIETNGTKEFISENLDVKFCTSDDCNMSVFDIGVDLEKSSGILKTVAVKNLVEKLKNNFKETQRTDLILSATLENSNNSEIKIKMDFPVKNEGPKRRFHCVFWDVKKHEWSEKGCLVSSSDRGQILCTCNHLTAFSVLMAKGDISSEALDMITNVGLAVSIFSLLLFLTIEFVVWSAVVKSNLSHFRHTAIVNIAVFLLLANCSFLASSSPESLSDTTCFVLTVCKHLFFLAMFTWMLCMSVMLVHQLIFVFSPLRKRVFMFLSSILGYVVPILIVGSSYVYCKYTFKDYYNRKTCWLVFERLLEGSMHAFLIPVGCIVLTNLFSMVVVIVTLVRSSATDSSKADDKDTAKGILKVVLVLTPIFGVTWIIGFFQLMLDETDPMYMVAIYSFTILNSFQGLFLLITGCFAEQKVREEFIKVITGKSKGGDTSKNLTSTTYTKDK
ncbi:probable G-protein coupled receptor 115 [Stegastes partitus]|uniref:Probable G-protein coupled receptor 115 n=1 Tax=Stegastes partitus TaxID=144197 RepID=A0A3B5APX9_9TELE|nr:PREDICTED: probable G-protein coupled receptor 115 [Stegastes partitus]